VFAPVCESGLKHCDARIIFLMSRWSCPITLLRYFTRLNLQSDDIIRSACEEAVRLNLMVLGRVPIIGVGRARSIADIAELEIEWLDQTRAVKVIISNGDDSLLGTELLDGSRLVIDYRTKRMPAR
jgi:hypothetical protein